MASKHAHKGSSRGALPRRTTRGPLVDDDPLSASLTPMSSSARSSLTLPSAPPQPDAEDGLRSSALHSPALDVEPEQTPTEVPEKDLSFLLDPSIYHPLSQLDLPAPFRRPFPRLPSATTPLSESLSHLDALLATCDYLSVAHLAGGILASGSVKPTDLKNIFRLLSIRYCCLELTGNTLLAAQESKAFEDLASTFYYYEQAVVTETTDYAPKKDVVPTEYIVPFPLRLQALRLQSIGFSDPRRGVSALYDLGMECREQIAYSKKTGGDETTWSARLAEIGIKVVNALIEIGDLDCASRTLASLKPDGPEKSFIWSSRVALLHLKIGDIGNARRVIDELPGSEHNNAIVEPLFAVAEGRYEDAAKLWERQLEVIIDEERTALIKQNLAVAYLYSGMMLKARDLMTELVDGGRAFESLTINLATLYELSSDRSKDLKIAMAGKIATQQRARNELAPKTNAVFKL